MQQLLTANTRRLLTLMIAVCAVFSVTLISAQPEISPELEAQLDELEVYTREARGLDGETVQREFPTRQEVIEYIYATFEEELPPEEIVRVQLFYETMGFVDADVHIMDEYLALLGDQIAGFYDTETRIMSVVPIKDEPLGDKLSLMEQIIYVHEYTHALQGQFYDVFDLINSDAFQEEGNTDLNLALTALFEGDATFVMTLFSQEAIQKNPLAALSLLSDSLAAGNASLPEGTPEILANELLFPYEDGLVFVNALYLEGGWDAVNEAYINLPASTEHILHPDKYLAGEAPIIMTLEDNSAVLGEGWQLEWDTPFGEWYLREWLRMDLEKSIADEAAAGWGGDFLHMYSNGEDAAFILAQAWDTATDADEFIDAYESINDARYSDVNEGCWLGDDKALCLYRIDAENTIIIQAPTQDQALALLEAQQVATP